MSPRKDDLRRTRTIQVGNYSPLQFCFEIGPFIGIAGGNAEYVHDPRSEQFWGWTVGLVRDWAPVSRSGPTLLFGDPLSKQKTFDRIPETGCTPGARRQDNGCNHRWMEGGSDAVWMDGGPMDGRALFPSPSPQRGGEWVWGRHWARAWHTPPPRPRRRTRARRRPAAGGRWEEPCPPPQQCGTMGCIRPLAGALWVAVRGAGIVALRFPRGGGVAPRYHEQLNPQCIPRFVATSLQKDPLPTDTHRCPGMVRNPPSKKMCLPRPCMMTKTESFHKGKNILDPQKKQQNAFKLGGFFIRG